MVKLDAMENPYSLPEDLRRELAQALARVDLNRYPAPSPQKLRDALARRMGVPQGMQVLLGNGSDELIQIVTTALARPGAAMMFPSPTFVMYSMGAVFAGMKAVAVPLREDFSLDAAAFIARMKAERPALVFLAWPNNPTGVLYPEEDIVEVIKACEGLVVVDEAYHAFAGRSFIAAAARFENLVIIGRFRKSGWRGSGWVPGRRPSGRAVRQGASTYNVSVLTPAAGCSCSSARGARGARARIESDRGTLASPLALKGVTVFPGANSSDSVPDADRTHESLKQAEVLVKKSTLDSHRCASPSARRMKNVSADSLKEPCNEDR